MAIPAVVRKELAVHHGWDGHGWAWFLTRLSLSFDFSCAIICTRIEVRKGEGEPGYEATSLPASDIVYYYLD